jgi:hypothetical protein
LSPIIDWQALASDKADVGTKTQEIQFKSITDIAMRNTSNPRSKLRQGTKFRQGKDFV